MLIIFSFIIFVDVILFSITSPIFPDITLSLLIVISLFSFFFHFSSLFITLSIFSLFSMPLRFFLADNLFAFSLLFSMLSLFTIIYYYYFTLFHFHYYYITLSIFSFDISPFFHAFTMSLRCHYISFFFLSLFSSSSPSMPFRLRCFDYLLSLSMSITPYRYPPCYAFLSPIIYAFIFAIIIISCYILFSFHYFSHFLRHYYCHITFHYYAIITLSSPLR